MPTEPTVAIFTKGDTATLIRVTITQNKVAQNTTGWTVKLYGKSDAGTAKAALTAVAFDAANGKWDFDVASWLDVAPASIKFQVESTDTVGKHRRSVRDYWMRVKQKVEDWAP